MVRMFRTSDGAIHEIQEPQDGCWVALTNPTATEIFEISEQFQIEGDDLRAPLDEEERSRIEVEDNYTLILDDFYDMSGRYTGSYQIYGGTCA